MVVPGGIQGALGEVDRTQAEERKLHMRVAEDHIQVEMTEDRIQDGEKELRTRTAKARSLVGQAQEDHRDTAPGHSLGLEKDRARDRGQGRTGLPETDCSIPDDYHSRGPDCMVDTENQKEV